MGPVVPNLRQKAKNQGFVTSQKDENRNLTQEIRCLGRDSKGARREYKPGFLLPDPGSRNVVCIIHC
jgi:hypothetical protein